MHRLSMIALTQFGISLTTKQATDASLQKVTATYLIWIQKIPHLLGFFFNLQRPYSSLRIDTELDAFFATFHFTFGSQLWLENKSMMIT